MGFSRYYCLVFGCRTRDMLFYKAISANLLPTKSMIVCSTGRSGSTLLCTTLSSLNCIGKAQEFFLPKVLAQNAVYSSADELYRYFPKVYKLGTTPNGVFSVKLHWDHMKSLIQIARTDPDLRSKSNQEILTLFFPSPYFIFIRRNNLVKQAISMEIAHQTGVYAIPKDFCGQLPYSDQKLFFRPLNIYRYKQGLLARNANWLLFFMDNNLSFFEVVYEDLVQELAPTIRQILAFSDIKLSEETIEITQAIRKQANQTNENWYRYYSWLPEGLLARYSELRSLVKKMVTSQV